MGTESGREANPVNVRLAAVAAHLCKEPWTFDFFQAIRLLTLLQPERTPIGDFSLPRQEAVRIGGHASLSFPASQIQSLSWDDGAQPLIRVNFFGLTGPLGLLPPPYTELLIDRLRARDHTLEDFLDIFHHRMASLFYKAWEKTHFPVRYERNESEIFSEALYALIGLGTAGLRNRQTVTDETFLFYGGLYGMATRPAVALRAILSDYFDAPVEIEQFVGVWRRLEEADCSFLESGALENYQLGVGAVVGDEVWDQQSRVRIQIGPLDVKRYQEFLPDGAAYQPLRGLVRAFCGDELEFEVQLILKSEQVPRCELGEEGSEGPRLGWLTWMKNRPDFGRNPGDTLLSI